MNLKELEELKQCNELDMIFKIIDKANGIKKRAERIFSGSRLAGMETRKVMQDIRLLAEIIRDDIQTRFPNKKIVKRVRDSRLTVAIKEELDRLEREESLIRRMEENRKKNKEERIRAVEENRLNQANKKR